jgi:erythromycin esterase
MKVLAALFLFLLALAPAGAASRPAAHPFLDLDFEAPECSSGWLQGASGHYDLRIDGSRAHSGRQSMEIHSVSSLWTSSSYGIFQRDFPLAQALGRTLRLTAFVQTEGITAGSLEMYGEAVDAEGNSVASASLQGQGPRGDTPWTPYTIEIAVPSSAQEVYFGFQLAGNGTAWVDSLSVQVDGRLWADGKPASLAPPNRQALSWLRKQAIPVATVEAGNGFDDLQRLKAVIGDARIVSLGEQTHGTREFFQMKHRLVEFLASEMGFTLFAIEANMPEAYLVNRYVLTGQGDPGELLKGMYFWTWNTQEVLDMIRWMREFNQSGRGRIEFLGFDMQFTRVAANVVRDLVAKAESGYSGHATELINRVNAANDRGTATAADLAAAQELYGHLAQNRGGYLARASREEVDWGIQNARVMLQAMQMLAGTVSRDESMAANVDWILEQNPDAKIVLWAHNGHVTKTPGAMGSYIAERYGPEAVALGFAFDEGSYNARNFLGNGGRVGANEALPPAPNSIEAYLNAAGLPRFILDLRRVPAGGPATWLKQPRPFREIGAIAKRCGSYPTVATDTFDGLIWIDQSTPSQLLRF